MTSEFLHILKERGFIHQCSDIDALDLVLKKEAPVSAYIGFDPTATSLHAGSLTQIMMLRWLQKTGHRPVVLIGGGTAQIGDPSGKDKQRQMISPDLIAQNSQQLAKIFSNYISFGSKANQAILCNNADWLPKLNYIDFLRDITVHFSVNRMLGFDSIRLRLEREQALSFLEFNYMVLQAYDFLQLSQKNNCRLQMGGSDQWGNILCGIDLARRINATTLFGLTSPLLTTASGAKMGKTANGTIWLDPNLTSPYEFWQFWRNCEDGDVGKFLRLFTELPIKEIEKLEKLAGNEINEAKKILATHATTLCHSEKQAEQAANTAKKLFEEKETDEHMPEHHISANPNNLLAFDLFHQAGLAETKSAARRLIRGRGGKINDRIIALEDEIISLKEEATNQKIKLSAGKKRHKILIIKS